MNIYFVHQSVVEATKGRTVKYRNMIFSAAIQDRGLNLFLCVNICLIDAHLFYEYIVPQFVGQAIKRIDV